MELQKKKDTDLAKLLKDKREELREFRFGMSGSKTNNTKLGMHIKRDIARIQTELNSRVAQ